MDLSSLRTFELCSQCAPEFRFYLMYDGISVSIGWDPVNEKTIVYNQEEYYTVCGASETLRDIILALGFKYAEIHKKVQVHDVDSNIDIFHTVNYENCMESSLDSTVKDGCEWDIRSKELWGPYYCIIYEIQ